MSKKNLYFAEAERLYVHDLNSLEEIVSKIKNVSERTLRNWKEEGSWADKRIQAQRSKQSFHEELYEFCRALMKSIKDDLINGKEIAQSRMYAFVNLIPKIYKVQEYEEATKNAEAVTGKKELSEADIKQIQEMLGL